MASEIAQTHLEVGFDLFMDFMYAAKAEVCMFVLATLIYLLFATGFRSKCQSKGNFNGMEAPIDTKNKTFESTRNGKPWQQRQTAAPPKMDHQHKLIQNCGHEGKLEEAVAAFEAMKRKSSPITSSSYNCILEACLQCGSLTAAVKYLNEAKRSSIADTTHYNTVLKSCLHANNLDQAWELVTDMKNHGVTANQHTYHLLLTTCMHAQDSEAAWRCVDQMRESGLQPNTATCTILFKMMNQACGNGESDSWPRIMALVDEVNEAMDSEPKQKGEGRVKTWNQRSHTCLVAEQAKSIRSHGIERNLDKAIAIFEAMKQSSMGTNSLSYNSILEACVQCSDMASALKYLAEATASGVADIVSHNTVMKGHLASNDMEGAWDLLAKMKKGGFAANHRTYHSLLHSSIQCKDREAAWRCIDQMFEDDLKPTTITCTILFKLITTMGCEGDMPRVMQLADAVDEPVDEAMFASLIEACLQTRRLDLLAGKIRDRKLNDALPKLSAPTYGAMIKAYGAARNVDQIWVLWEEMRRCEVLPTMITLGCMVEALVMNGCADGAWQLIQNLWAEETQRHLVNTVIYSTVLKGFAIARRMDKVLGLYDEMRERAIELNTITYNTLLNALVRCSDMKRVPQILLDMRTASPPIEPDKITYSTIMKGYCSAGELDKGLALLQDIEDSTLFTPDEVMFNSLLDGCAKEQRLSEALALMNKMKAANVIPSNYTLSIMIKLLGRTKRLNQAFSLVKELSSEHGFRPNIFVYTCLIQACFLNKQPRRALMLHDEIVKEGCLFDEKAYVALALGLVRAGDPETAADVVRCAFGLPGGTLCGAPGSTPGVDWACVEEVCSKLRAPRIPRGAEKAQQLLADIKLERSNSSGSRPRHAVKSPPPQAWKQPKYAAEVLGEAPSNVASGDGIP